MIRTASFALHDIGGRVEIECLSTGQRWLVPDDELDLIMLEAWVEASHDPAPHCVRCDESGCSGSLPGDAESAFVAYAGHKPATPGILRAAWESALAIWCRAWRACAARLTNSL